MDMRLARISTSGGAGNGNYGYTAGGCGIKHRHNGWVVMQHMIRSQHTVVELRYMDQVLMVQIIPVVLVIITLTVWVDIME